MNYTSNTSINVNTQISAIAKFCAINPSKIIYTNVSQFDFVVVWKELGKNRMTLNERFKFNLINTNSNEQYIQQIKKRPSLYSNY